MVLSRTRAAVGALALSAVLALTGCGGSSSAGSSGASASSTAHGLAAASSSALASASPTEEACGSDDTTTAFTKAMTQVKAKYDVGAGHPWAPADTKAYDRCADLSAIRASQTDGNWESAEFVLLFHKGRFYGTARTQPVGRIIGTVTRKGSSTVSFGLVSIDSFEDSAKTTPDTTLTYTWDKSSGRVKQSGKLIDPDDKLPTPVSSFTSGSSTSKSTAKTASKPAASTAPSILANGAWAGAKKGSDPAGAGAWPIVKSYDGYTIPQIQSPSGNIQCGVRYKGYAGLENLLCWVNNRASNANWGSTIYSDGHSANDVQGSDGSDTAEAGKTLPYGQTVSDGTWACHSEESGMTCWNIKSGHGVIANKSKGAVAF